MRNILAITACVAVLLSIPAMADTLEDEFFENVTMPCARDRLTGIGMEATPEMIAAFIVILKSNDWDKNKQTILNVARGQTASQRMFLWAIAKAACSGEFGQ